MGAGKGKSKRVRAVASSGASGPEVLGVRAAMSSNYTANLLQGIREEAKKGNKRDRQKLSQYIVSAWESNISDEVIAKAAKMTIADLRYEIADYYQEVGYDQGSDSAILY